LLTLSLALLMAGYGRPRWQLALAAMIILVLDLWGYGGKFVATHEMGDNAGWSLADAALPGERHTYRVLSSGLPQNLAALYGFQHLSGYDDFRLETGLRLEELAEKDVRIAQLLGVRFMYTIRPWAACRKRPKAGAILRCWASCRFLSRWGLYPALSSSTTSLARRMPWRVCALLVNRRLILG
jgi:hypothetical protein